MTKNDHSVTESENDWFGCHWDLQQWVKYKAAVLAAGLPSRNIRYETNRLQPQSFRSHSFEIHLTGDFTTFYLDAETFDAFKTGTLCYSMSRSGIVKCEPNGRLILRSTIRTFGQVKRSNIIVIFRSHCFPMTDFTSDRNRIRLTGLHHLLSNIGCLEEDAHQWPQVTWLQAEFVSCSVVANES